MRAGTTWRWFVGAVISLSIAGFAATRFTSRHSSAPAVRHLPPPFAVQQAFQRFSDSAGTRLVETLFKLGYHGGYSWDEKDGPVRANLVTRTDSGSVADSTSGVHEGILSLDFHHDVHDVPPGLSLRFVNCCDSPKWILLTTDSYPEDPSPETPLETIRNLPRELHDAMLASFGDHADAFDFWKSQEHRQPLPSIPATK